MLIALLAGTFPLLAVQGKANEQFQFTHINTANSDISFDGISKIMQDSRGFIWIGTFKGLNRYDGTRFVTYYKEQLGLDSDFIHTIIEDKEGNLDRHRHRSDPLHLRQGHFRTLRYGQ